MACVVEVERTGTRSTKPYAERMYYASSHTAEAAAFARIVRGHWQIENALHWVKDVVLGEDACATRAGYAPHNGALLRSWAVTLFRLHGFRSITAALRRLAHDVPVLCRMLQ